MDRRAEYTIRVIKEAFLRVLSEKDFAHTTIADVCREADIHRSTFYLHFTRKEDVLDALLEEAFAQIESSVGHICNTDGDTCKVPLCLFIRGNRKFQPIFTDASLGDYVIGRLARHFKDGFVHELSSSSPYSEDEAETIFWFQIHGCYSLTVYNIHLSPEAWERKKNALDRFIRKGIL